MATILSLVRVQVTLADGSAVSSNQPTIVSTDASSYEMGGVLQQIQPSGEVKPVAYASRSMSPTEQRYAQIEKEALALTYGLANGLVSTS